MQAVQARTRITLKNILFATDFSPAANLAALIAIPTAGAIQVVTREIWRSTEPVELLDTSAALGPPSTTAPPARQDASPAGSATSPGQAGPGDA